MKVSRREFVSTAGFAATASLCGFPLFGFSVTDSRVKAARCTVVDLQSNCVLPESFVGMRAALGDSHRCITENELSSNESSLAKFVSSGAPIIVVPAAASVYSRTYAAALELAEQGATILWESGAAFLEHREFAKQQTLTDRYFDILLQKPIELWQRGSSPPSSQKNSVNKSSDRRKMRALGHEQIPYIEYSWPSTAHVRDFSRVIPLTSSSGRPIARWQEIPVAWSRTMGAGALIFFGSPLGPALRAGDSEALHLLHSIMAE
jgi:hypothetical protein